MNRHCLDYLYECCKEKSRDYEDGDKRLCNSLGSGGRGEHESSVRCRLAIYLSGQSIIHAIGSQEPNQIIV